jgi:hypothetical protein
MLTKSASTIILSKNSFKPALVMGGGLVTLTVNPFISFWDLWDMLANMHASRLDRILIWLPALGRHGFWQNIFLGANIEIFLVVRPGR